MQGDSIEASRFAFRKRVTVEGGRNPAGIDLTDFPLAVRLTDPDLRMTSAGGKLETGVDLAFFSDDGVTPLAFELEHLVADRGELVAWVNLPVLAGSGATTFYLAFGDPETTAEVQDPAATWNAGYVGVWHFAEPGYAATAGEVADATGAHFGTPSGTVTTREGKLGRAASLGGNCDKIVMEVSAALQPASVTVSAWVMPQDIGVMPDRIATIVAQDSWRATGTGSQGYYLEVYRTVSQPEPTFYAADGPTYAHAFGSSQNVTNDVWYYFVGTYDAASGTSSIYLNGELAGTSTMTGPIDYLAKPVQIGCGSSGWWKGAIDEVRIAPTAHAAARIAAEYASQVDPAFLTVAPTEATPGR